MKLTRSSIYESNWANALRERKLIYASVAPRSVHIQNSMVNLSRHSKIFWVFFPKKNVRAGRQWADGKARGREEDVCKSSSDTLCPDQAKHVIACRYGHITLRGSPLGNTQFSSNCEWLLTLYNVVSHVFLIMANMFLYHNVRLGYSKSTTYLWWTFCLFTEGVLDDSRIGIVLIAYWAKY